MQRKEQKEITRKLILNTALEQFAKGSLTGTRTSDIAKAAKVSHGTLFAHFPTRDILLDAVIEEFGRRITNRLHELACGNCELKELLFAHLKGISEYEAFYTTLISEIRLLNKSSQDSLVMIQSAISFHFLQVLERDRNKNKIKQLPLAFLFNNWIGLIHYYLINSNLFAPDGSVLERYGNQLVEYYISLVTQKKGEEIL